MTDTPHPSVRLNDGVEIPQLGLGVWQTPADETASAVRTAVEAGYRMIDTATIYRNEEGVGEALADHPDVFVTTKVWNGDQGYDSTLRAFDASAKRLRRDVLDLYLIHWPAPRQDRYVETWKALLQLKADGRIRSAGVSNFNPDHLERIIGETGEAPSVNQVELHPRFQRRDLRAVHERLGVATQSWSPLGQGQLLQDETLAAIAAKHGKTPAQVIVRWHMDNGIIVFPKSVNPERIRQNADVFDFRLDAEDLERIGSLDSAAGRIGPDPATADF